LRYSPDSPGKSLTLLIPGLFGFPADAPLAAPQAPPPLPALETLLARADRLPAPPPDYESLIFGQFGIGATEDADLPVAAVTRALDLGVIDKGWWLRADPVHLRAERDRLILFDTQAVSLRQEEAERLAAEVGEAYSADGWLLKAPRPGRWYLRPARAPRIRTTPLPQVVGKDIHPYLPQGRDAKAWHTVLNEVQILLHTASVNTERERRGELPINSLWFWGGGRLPSIAPVEWAQVHGDEPLCLALARLSEVPSGAAPASFGEWLRLAERPGAHLVVLDGARAPVQYGDAEQWRALLERLEREWMAPLQDALRARELRSLTLTADGRAFRVDGARLRRWWRRRRPFAAYR
jgi:hypothetical protein